MAVTGYLQRRAREIRTDAYALYLARRDPRVPWQARALAVIVLAYAFSPIDLIPDFIPVLGYLDDIIIVPLGVALVVRLVPHEVWEEYRCRAGEGMSRVRPGGRLVAAVVILSLWLLALAWLAKLAWRFL